MGLYERLVREATQEAEKNPEREAQRRRLTQKRQKMQAYIKRRPMPVAKGGGYVTSEEIREVQERHLADLQALCSLVSGGVKSIGAGYRLAYLRSTHPVEYAHFRDMEISSE